MPNLLIEDERLADKRAAQHATYVRWRDKMRADPARLAKLRRYMKRYGQANRRRMTENNKRWRRENPERYHAQQRRSQRLVRKRVTPARAVNNLCARLGLIGPNRFKVADVPVELIRAERAKILLGRRIRAKRKKLQTKKATKK